MFWLAALAIGMTHTAQLPPETKAQHDQRMNWWREARFGMFIHWGLYAVPAGVWNGKNVPGAAEWLMYSAKVKPADYEPLLHQFNPVKFDARRWVSIAKGAGMKYIVITSKHHEGFALWPSKQGTWNIGYTPFKRDILKELARACKEQGIRLCFYHSIMDWHHPDYLPRRPWDDRPTDQANFDRYVSYMKAQLKELLSGEYGPIGILWFDGEWEGTWTHERGKDLYAFVRSLQPNIIVNNRVDKGRGGMGGMSDVGFAGDYGTPEQEIPANGLPGVDWESCMTMNDTWGFHQNDHNWKSAETLVKNLIDCASKGGNYLLNVGPTGLGEIPQPSVERLAKVGGWLKVNGEAIYGTKAGPFPKPLPWGRVTQRPGKLYLHTFTSAYALPLPGLRAKIKRAYELGDKRPLNVQKTNDGYEVNLGIIEQLGSLEWMPHVYVLEVDGPVSVELQPLRAMSDGVFALTAEDANVKGSAQYESDKHAIGYWTSKGDTVSWDFLVDKAGRYGVEVEYACEPAAAGSAYEVRIGNQVVKGQVESTGSWSAFRKDTLGTVELPAGKQKLVVSALTMPGGAVMNLRSVRLKPL